MNQKKRNITNIRDQLKTTLFKGVNKKVNKEDQEYNQILQTISNINLQQQQTNSPITLNKNNSSPSRNPKINPIINDFNENYLIEDQILGQGSHAVVKLCTNRLNKKNYAVKIIRNGDIEVIQGII